MLVSKVRSSRAVDLLILFVVPKVWGLESRFIDDPRIAFSLVKQNSQRIVSSTNENPGPDFGPRISP